jgi:Ion channel
MTLVLVCCLILLLTTTAIHYEVLRLLSFGLGAMRIPARVKLNVVIVAAFTSHALQMLLYGVAYYGAIHVLDLGDLIGGTGSSWANCLYFSAETFTSLGLGDLVPSGPVRMIAGAETLNGLLLIGWSASFTYLAMERFWLPPIPRAA